MRSHPVLGQWDTACSCMGNEEMEASSQWKSPSRPGNPPVTDQWLCAQFETCPDSTVGAACPWRGWRPRKRSGRESLPSCTTTSSNGWCFIKHRFTTLRNTEGLSADDDSLLELSSAIGDTIASIERICRGLTPLELKHFGLSFALRILFREYSEAGFAVHGNLMEVGRELDPATALAVFRIVQESLSNAREHSGADEALVTMTRDSDWIEVEVRDAGVGFETAAVASAGSGIGLLGMSERAAMVGGVFEVRSNPGGGTRIRVRVPVAGQGTAEEDL